MPYIICKKCKRKRKHYAKGLCNSCYIYPYAITSQKGKGMTKEEYHKKRMDVLHEKVKNVFKEKPLFSFELKEQGNGFVFQNFLRLRAKGLKIYRTQFGSKTGTTTIYYLEHQRREALKRTEELIGKIKTSKKESLSFAILDGDYTTSSVSREKGERSKYKK